MLKLLNPRFVWRKIILILEAIRLKKKIPQLRNYSKLAGESRTKLQPYYDEYISDISSNDMAISFELAVFLTVMCKIFKPKSILDLGSGFSSLIFRSYQLNAAVKPVIWSIDDSPVWLDKTRGYLAKHDLPTENLDDWHSFIKQNRGTFDLILLDLSTIDFRKKILKEVLALAHPGGMVVLDDVHKEHYGSFVKKVLNESNCNYDSLRFWTKDKLGRYSMLVTH